MSSIKDGDAREAEPATCDAPAGGGMAPSSPQRKRPPDRPPSPKNCRSFIRRQTADAMPDIVSKFVNRAKEGSVPHFTSLAKVGGFDQRLGSAEVPKRKRRSSLARRLLDEVERYEAKQTEELAAASPSASNPSQNGVRSPQEDS